MKKYTPSQLISLLAAPVLLVVLGLVLLFSPDTASALVGKLLAWVCILAALALGAGAFFGIPARRSNRILWAVICLAAGVWMLKNPLTIAKFLGRVLGLTLVLLGARSTTDNIRYQGNQPILSRGLILGVVTMLAGAVLVLLPLASSRMFFHIVGIGLICIGIAQGADNLRGRKLLDDGDSSIIDVEKL